MVSVLERELLFMVISIFVVKIHDSIHLESCNTMPVHYFYNKHKQ